MTRWTGPVVLCEPVRPPRGRTEWQWRFWCPFCRRHHSHGAGAGHRTTHCDTGSYKPGPHPFERGYVLRLDPRFRSLERERLAQSGQSP